MHKIKITQYSLIPRMVERLGKISIPVILGVTVVMLVLIGILDFFRGRYLTLAALYLLPIGLVSLRLDRRAGLVASFVCGVVWLYLDNLRVEGFTPWPDAWNMTMRVGIFVAFALVLSRIKWDIMNEMKLNSELQAALAEVKQLSGLLPICAWCKRIRDEEGNWEPMETYITVHSEADFTHGICPDCARKYHPSAQ